MTRFLVLRPDSICVQLICLGQLQISRWDLFQHFVKIIQIRKLLTQLDLGAMAASQQGFDVVYPAIGDQLNFLHSLRDESGVRFIY